MIVEYAGRKPATCQILVNLLPQRTGQTARPFFLRENQKTDIINNHWKDFSLDTKQDGATQKIILKKKQLALSIKNIGRII